MIVYVFIIVTARWQQYPEELPFFRVLLDIMTWCIVAGDYFDLKGIPYDVRLLLYLATFRTTGDALHVIAGTLRRLSCNRRLGGS